MAEQLCALGFLPLVLYSVTPHATVCPPLRQGRAVQCVARAPRAGPTRHRSRRHAIYKRGHGAHNGFQPGEPAVTLRCMHAS